MKSKIFKNYLYNVIYQILVFLAPLITAPYLARKLGAELLGTYSYINSVAAIITTIGLIGLYNYGTRQIAYCSTREEMTCTFWEIMLLRSLFLIPGVFLYLIIAYFTHYFTLFLLYGFWFFAIYIDVSWLYVGIEDMKPAVIKNIFAKTLCILGIFIFVKENSDLWKYVLLISLSTFIANLLVWISLKKYIDAPKIHREKLIQHILGGFQLFLPQVTTTLYMQIGKIMLKWFTSSSQVSFYDQAEKITNIPLAFITVLSTVMMPRIASEFSKNEKSAMELHLNSAVDYSLFMALPMMFGMAGVASTLIPWYLGAEFIPCINAIYFLSPVIIFNSLSGVSGNQYFTATNQINILMKAYVTATVINITFNAILIPHFGYAGAAATTLLSSLVSILIQYYYMKRQVRIKVFKPFVYKYLVFSVVMFSVVYLVGRSMGISILTTATQIGVGTLSYLIMLLLSRDKRLKSLLLKINFMKCKKNIET